MATTKINKKILVFIIICIISLFFVVFLLNNKKNDNLVKDTSLSNPYTDPGTGEIIYNQPNKTPEGNYILYIGFSKLIDLGLTSNQLKQIEKEVENFSLKNTDKIKEISIKLKSIKQNINQTTGEKNITFTTTVNRKDTYNFEIKYSDITNVKIFIYNILDQLLYNN